MEPLLGDALAARAQFEQAVEQGELQRASLPGDEFRTAYGADKQRPYDALIELAIEAPEPSASWPVLRAIERARAPALRTTLTVWASFLATQLVLRQAESLTEYS